MCEGERAATFPGTVWGIRCPRNAQSAWTWSCLVRLPNKVLNQNHVHGEAPDIAVSTFQRIPPAHTERMRVVTLKQHELITRARRCCCTSMDVT